MTWLFTNIVSALFLPPLNLLLAMILGMALLKRRPRFGKAVLWGAILTLWAASTPWLGARLLQSLEHTAPVVNSTIPPTQAIVVLGAGRYFNAPEYGGQDTISYFALERIRYANYLARMTNTPVLTSGGNPEQVGSNEGSLMKTSLEQDFQIQVKWVEDRSNNTADEAVECWKILEKDHVRKIYLVTHAWHMPRAVAAFNKAGFEVIPAPMGYTTARPFTLLDILPTAGGLSKTYIALHEWIGLLWYKLKGAS